MSAAGNTNPTPRVQGVVVTSEITGRELGGFRVEELLGKGGMGSVFRGRDVALDRPVAIKVLAAHLAEDPEYRERFVREARTAAKLNHSNIVQIYRAGHEQGLTYMALELVTGCTLYELMKRNPSFPPRVACHLVRGAAAGLAVAHELDIIHRDIKPENILVTPKGVAKLADFGLARSTNQRITATGVFLGTPQYSSPEQCNTDEVDQASDLYSLGVILYELLAGRPPHEAPTPLALFQKILNEQHVPLAQLKPGLPPSLSAVVNRLLEKDPADRYPSARELVDDLATIMAGLPEPGEGEDPIATMGSSVGLANVPSVHGRETTAEDGRETTATSPFGAPSEMGTIELPPGTTLASDDDEVDTEAQTREMRPAPKPNLLPAVVGVLVLALIGLLLAKPWAGSSDAGDGGSGSGGGTATRPKYTAPIKVAVIGWRKGEAPQEFAWLSNALLSFVRAELGKHGDAVRLLRGDEVATAWAESKDGRKVLEKLEGNLWIGGTYFQAGMQVGITTHIEDAQGEPISFAGSSKVVNKEAILGELQRLASALAQRLVALTRGQSPARKGPTPSAGEPTMLSSREQAKNARAPEAELAQAAAPRRNKAAPAPERKLEDLRRRGRLRKAEGKRKDSFLGRAGKKGMSEPKPKPKPDGGAEHDKALDEDAPRDGSKQKQVEKKEQQDRQGSTRRGKQAKRRAWGKRPQPKAKAPAQKPQSGPGSQKPPAPPRKNGYADQKIHPLLAKLSQAKSLKVWDLMVLMQKCSECQDPAVYKAALAFIAKNRSRFGSACDEVEKQLKQKLAQPN